MWPKLRPFFLSVSGLFDHVVTFLVCLFTCLAFFHWANAQDMEYKDGIVAVVNDDVITTYDVAMFNTDQENKIRAKYASKKVLEDEKLQEKFFKEINASRLQAINELVNQKLIHAEFEKKGFQLPNEVVDKRIDSVVASQAGGDWLKFEEMLTDSNTTMEKFRERIESNLAVELLMSQIVDRNINISPDAVESYYQDHKKDYTTPAKARLQIIGLKQKSNKNTKEDREHVGKVLSLLQNGTDFADAAMNYSDLPNKKKAGDLGWMLVSEIREEFRKGLKRIEKDEISAPIELDGITYLVKISDIEHEKIKSLDEIYDSIKSTLFISEKKIRYDEFIDELRSKSYVRLFFKK